MIYIELKGRLGNQFFRYAYARALQLKRGKDEQLVLGLSNMNGKDANDGWCDSLRDFHVIHYKTSNKRLVYQYGTIWQKIIDSLFFLDLRVFARNNRYRRMVHSRKWIDFLARYGLIHNVEEYHQYKIPKTKDVIIDGGFQNPFYFEPIKDLLQKEFTPRHQILSENISLYNIINNTNSVCISIRRGDFTSSRFSKIYNICSEEYYKKAVEIVKKEIDNPTLIVFSDEIEWAKNNLSFDLPTYYERGCDPLWEKVRLMTACKHFIISNSSFSWMIQYLGKSKNKIVISPDKWYNSTEFPCYLIEDSFIKIKV